MKSKIKKSTLIRTLCLAFALLNNLLTLCGINPIPFSDSEFFEGVSAVITVTVSLWSWWKNNSFTEEAIEADKILEVIKENKKIGNKMKEEI